MQRLKEEGNGKQNAPVGLTLTRPTPTQRFVAVVLPSSGARSQSIVAGPGAQPSE